MNAHPSSLSDREQEDSCGADWIAVGTVRVHLTGGNAGIAWSVESNGIGVRDGETVYVKGYAAPTWRCPNCCGVSGCATCAGTGALPIEAK